jgi:nitroreductase
MHKPAITQVPIAELIANRWSPRAYDASKAVSQAQITALCEAARWAPSSYNDQPWRFIVCDKNTDLAAWQKAFDCLMPNNQAWLINAPVLMLGCANTLLDVNQQANRFAQYDTGAAVENICLQATQMGLMTHQMGGYHADKAREAFAIPAQFTLMAMISVGYAAEATILTGDLYDREIAPRKRKPLGELFFNGHWNAPIDSKNSA